MQPYKKVAFYTLGCKLNFTETSTIARSFTEAGYAKVDFNDRPDIYVINTCSVTDNADKKCKQLVKKAKQINPYAKIIIIGCYAQLKPQEIAQINGVDLVLGANEKFNAINYLDNLSESTKIISGEIKHVKEFIPSYSAGDRTRTFFKVQDGCDYFCSFCTIPLARGRSRSATVKETVLKAKEAAKNGIKEIVLTGVNIGDFGKENPLNESFIDLIRELDLTENVERFRISSIEPNLLSNEIIEFVAQSKKFVPHFHIPLQSGNNDILKAMRRRYQRELYADRVAFIKSLMPHACIGVDVIVGFPGETDEKFLDTYNFINHLEVSYLHVFSYSERDNTTAVRMKEIVPMAERNKRSKMLHILSDKKKRAFYNQHLGNIRNVLFEAEEDHGNMYGFTDNYIKVQIEYNHELINKIVPVELCNINPEGIIEAKVLIENTLS
jgi:threonylcarbamoyladenosine tRNA methylthiotransferase MtaB